MKRTKFMKTNILFGILLLQSPRASAILAKMFEKLDGRGGKIKFLTWPSI